MLMQRRRETRTQRLSPVKSPTFRHFAVQPILIIAALLVLAACAPQPVTPSPTPTETVTPLPTHTLTPSVTPSATPSATLPITPTATATPLPTPTTTPTPRPTPRGLIALSARVDNNWDIYAVDPADGTRIRLTADPAQDRFPAWSPDGSQLAFASRRNGFWNLYLLTADGQITQLTDHPAYDGAPAWSPDGRRLAFESMRSGNLDIWLLDLEGGEPVNLTADSPRAEGMPAWSPDGTQIAFTSWRNGDADLFILDLSGGKTRQVTSMPGDEELLGWRQDGMLLYSQIDGETQDVYIRPPDAAHDAPGTPLTRWQVVGAATASPDGEYLAYLLRFTHDVRLLVQRVNGGWELPVYTSENMVIDGPLDWTITAVNWPSAHGTPTVLYEEKTAPGHGSPYDLVKLDGVEVGNPWLSDRVNDSFMAMRQRTIDECGRDFFAQLSDAWRDIGYDSGYSAYTSWHKTGRAIDTLMDYFSSDRRQRWLEVVLEPGGGEIYWRLYLRCANQDGSQGLPIRTRPWDLTAEARQALTGGRRKALPTGYYIDLTDLMAQYGWLRIAAHDSPDFHWHNNFVAVEHWHFQKTDGLVWYDAMLEVFPSDLVEQYHNWDVQREKGLPLWLAVAKGIPVPWSERKALMRLVP